MGMNSIKVIGAGLAGTFAMAALGVGATAVLHVHQPNPAILLASQLAGSVVVGAIAYLLIGVTLALVYAAAARAGLPGSPWLCGAIFAVILWLFTQMVILPMVGVAAFSGSIRLVATSLIEFLGYGVVIGTLIGRIRFPAHRAHRSRSGTGQSVLFRLDDMVTSRADQTTPRPFRHRGSDRQVDSDGPILVVGRAAKTGRQETDLLPPTDQVPQP